MALEVADDKPVQTSRQIIEAATDDTIEKAIMLKHGGNHMAPAAEVEAVGLDGNCHAGNASALKAASGLQGWFAGYFWRRALRMARFFACFSA